MEGEDSDVDEEGVDEDDEEVVDDDEEDDEEEEEEEEEPGLSALYNKGSLSGESEGEDYEEEDEAEAEEEDDEVEEEDESGTLGLRYSSFFFVKFDQYTEKASIVLVYSEKKVTLVNPNH